MDWTWTWGFLGGALPDVIRIAKGRYETELPKHLTSPNFYLGFIFLVLLGGGAAWLGSASDVKAALAFGFAGPEFISRSFSGRTPITMGEARGLTTLSRWWSF
jgi:hypothetical protein